jgi:hypothetical protein
MLLTACAAPLTTSHPVDCFLRCVACVVRAHARTHSHSNSHSLSLSHSRFLRLTDAPPHHEWTPVGSNGAKERNALGESTRSHMLAITRAYRARSVIVYSVVQTNCEPRIPAAAMLSHYCMLSSLTGGETHVLSRTHLRATTLTTVIVSLVIGMLGVEHQVVEGLTHLHYKRAALTELRANDLKHDLQAVTQGYLPKDTRVTSGFFQSTPLRGPHTAVPSLITNIRRDSVRRLKTVGSAAVCVNE